MGPRHPAHRVGFARTEHHGKEQIPCGSSPRRSKKERSATDASDRNPSQLHMRNSDQKSIMVNNFRLRTAANKIETKQKQWRRARLCRSTSFGHRISVMFKAFRS